MFNITKRPATSSISLRDSFFGPLEDQFDQFFSQWFGDPSITKTLEISPGYPKVDISVDGDKWIVRAAIPGVEPENVKIELTDRVVRISGEMAKEHKSETAQYQIREMHKSRFSREIYLPDEATGEPEAEIKNGILSLSWKYAKPEPVAKTKLIKITKVDEPKIQK